MGFLSSLAAFVVVVGILVVVHEYGHFWVARRCGVKVLRFSVGFGRALWTRRFGADATELVVAAIPLGGYVKMLDEREGPVAAADLSREFNHQGLAVRSAIVSAGPLSNLLFAALAYWLMFMIGVSGLKPRIGEVEPGSIAARAGLEAGLEVITVNGQETPTWDAVVAASVPAVIEGGSLTVTVRDRQGRKRELSLPVGGIPVDDLAHGGLLKQLGIAPDHPVVPAVIGRVRPEGAAQAAGLKSGDRVLRADGQPLASWEDWVSYIREHPEQSIRVEVERGAERLSLDLRPVREEDEQGRPIGRIGAEMPPPPPVPATLIGVERYGPIEAFVRGVDRTAQMAVLTLRLLGKMLVGNASVRNLSGPISIAQVAGESAGMGLAAFLSVLGIVSVSLAVLNLLPVPLLDGGHLLYYLMEFVSGRPVPLAVQQVGQQIGLVLLALLMAIAFYNDLARILG
ncbi:MAG: RIP metalloprotease RseP [Gammaproteobacteria bacterium]